MSTFPSPDGPTTNDKNDLPEDQQRRAEQAHLQVDTTADQAEAGTPRYGNFGKANETEPAVPTQHKNDGSNDNPDEFSEFRKPGQPVTEDYGTSADAASPDHQQGHIEQNQAPGEVKAAQNKETDEQRAAWSSDDERYAGGHREASWEESNDKEHSND
ncbi:hypothetical protein FNT36_05505 [Hymenobacter setariae]|uniref:Uncharacterized protein n=1 Tax=Hymenobacter setariae TaxID=2594794 RepID=A0A558C410_9BACT|nr:hypothetical protein [Hymenobacter setariae]TVT43541.1 hypothetical protein FNT36_05505 [Hymenobacter setariae]